MFVNMEYDEIKENIEWLSCLKNDLSDLKKCLLKCLTKIGPRKKTIERETKFAEPTLVEKDLKLKTMLDFVDNNEFISARSACNQFDPIANKSFYFADVCAGPGGFTDYCGVRS